jgi:hypothetical protein
MDRCDKCGTALVGIDSDTVAKIAREINPVFKSLKKMDKNNFQICPRCDAYALGIEMQEGFPFILPNGSIKTIHEIGDIFNCE